MNEVAARVRMLAEVFGKQLSEPAAVYFAQGLSNYPHAQIIKALDRCLVECKRFPAIAEIIERLDDGRPGVNEAWALVPKDESASCVWTDEMRQAFFVALPILNAGNETQAFFAFKEKYEGLLSEARVQGRPADWQVSLGHSVHGRKAALIDAVDKKRLTHEQAQRLVPELPAPTVTLPMLPEMPR